MYFIAKKYYLLGKVKCCLLKGQKNTKIMVFIYSMYNLELGKGKESITCDALASMHIIILA